MLYKFRYTSGVTRVRSFNTKGEAEDFAFNEGDHLETWYSIDETN